MRGNHAAALERVKGHKKAAIPSQRKSRIQRQETHK